MTRQLDRLEHTIRHAVEADAQPGRYRCDRRIFTDEALFEMEMKHIFEGNWVFLAHESQVENPGDYYTTYVGRQPVILTRTKDGELKAILNALSERDPEADICLVKGQPEADAGLRDNENVPLGESVYDYFEREVKPHVPDAWIDESKRDAQDGEVGVVGFEIPFNRHFYEFTPPRPLEDIDADLKQCTDRIKQMIEELSA